MVLTNAQADLDILFVAIGRIYATHACGLLMINEKIQNASPGTFSRKIIYSAAEKSNGSA